MIETLIGVVTVAVIWYLHVRLTNQNTERAEQQTRAVLAAHSHATSEIVTAIRAQTSQLVEVTETLLKQHDITVELANQLNARMYDHECTMWDLGVRVANSTPRRVRLP